MSAIAIRQMVDRVDTLMEERLHVRGSGLAGKLKRGGRRLPRQVRLAAKDLAVAGEMARNPRLLMQVDFEKVSADYDLCVRHLTAVDRKARILAKTLDVVRLAVVVGVLAAGVAYALGRWRGLI